MSVTILIASAFVSFIVNVIIDKFTSNKGINDESSDFKSETVDNLNTKFDTLSIKINDLFKVLKDDSTKGAISETNTYIKAIINEVATVKKSLDAISVSENRENIDYSEQISNLENKIDEINDNVLKKFDYLEDIIKSIDTNKKESSDTNLNDSNEEKVENTDDDTFEYVENHEETEISDDKDEEDKENNEIARDKDEIDTEFNPGEIDLETTPIEAIVKNQKTEENSNTIIRWNCDMETVKIVPTTKSGIKDFTGGAVMIGDMIFVANRGPDTIACFDEDLFTIGEYPCGGLFPRSLSCMEYGENNILACCCQKSDECWLFLPVHSELRQLLSVSQPCCSCFLVL